MNKTAELFGKFAAAYGYLWQNQFGDERMLNFSIKLWSKKIERLESIEINFGFEKCIDNLPYPPTLPQFVQKCEVEAEDVGFLSWEESYANQDDIYHEVAKTIDKWTWGLMKAQDHKKEFKTHYKIFVKNYLAMNNAKNKKLEFIKQILLPKENKDG